MHQKLYLTRKDSCWCAKRLLLLAGILIMVRSLLCGEVDASSEGMYWEVDGNSYTTSVDSMIHTGFLFLSAFLGNIKMAFEKNPNLQNLLLDPFFKKAITDAQASWRRIVSTAALNGVPTPAFSTALAFYDGYRCARLPANLLQVGFIPTLERFYSYLRRPHDIEILAVSGSTRLLRSPYLRTAQRTR